MGLDYGSKTVGVAISDALRLTAQAVETITGKEFMKIYRRCEGIPEPEEKKEENPVKEQTIEMPKKEADTEAAQQEEKETQKKVERDEDGFILPQKRD